MDKPTVILIAGPTASGKSALALSLAEKLGGIIVNADSMQVYRDLRVITARPTPEEEARVPHRLYGHVDAAKNYSVGQWCRDVGEALRETRSAGPRADPGRRHRALFQGADHGLAAVPPIPADIRERVRARVRERGRAGAACRTHDARSADRAAADAVNDRSRISRALEVVLATGRSLTDWHREGLPPLVDPDARGQGLPHLRAQGAGARASKRALPPCSKPARSRR